MSSSSRGPDLGFVLTWLKRYWLAVWFGVISAMRLQVLVTGQPGFDAQLYLDGDPGLACRRRPVDHHRIPAVRGAAADPHPAGTDRDPARSASASR